jgi:hypothetical protein
MFLRPINMRPKSLTLQELFVDFLGFGKHQNEIWADRGLSPTDGEKQRVKFSHGVFLDFMHLPVLFIWQLIVLLSKDALLICLELTTAVV